MKPVLTDKVLRGIVAACSVVLAGDIASAFGNEDAGTRKAWDDTCRAQDWAKAMIDWRATQHSQQK